MFNQQVNVEYVAPKPFLFLSLLKFLNLCCCFFSGALVWFVMSELFFGFSPNKVYSDALKKIKTNDEVCPVHCRLLILAACTCIHVLCELCLEVTDTACTYMCCVNPVYRLLILHACTYVHVLCEPCL